MTENRMTVRRTSLFGPAPRAPLAPLALLASSLVLLTLSCTGPSEPAIEFELTATVQDIMLTMVDPTADEIWEAVATIVTPGHVEERRPQSDEEWLALRRSAITLVEATNLLLIPGRLVAAPGIKSENPGLELEPEDIAARIAEDPETWAEYVHGLHEASLVMLEAINEKDADKLFDFGGPLDVACEGCHRHYWYPEEIKPWEIPDSTVGANASRVDLDETEGVALATVARADTGTVRGNVVLDGRTPGNRAIRMRMDPKCSDVNAGKQVLQEVVLTSPEGGLANVFVQLEGVFPSRPIPSDPVVIDQRGCVFASRVLGARIGQTVELRNSDPLAHNVRSLSSANNGFNLGQPFEGMVSTVHFERETGMLKLKCDTHRWMTAFVGIVDHPYFAVSDRSGDFTIDNVPAGTHRIQAWHEEYGPLSETVSIEDGTTTSVTFTYTTETS